MFTARLIGTSLPHTKIDTQSNLPLRVVRVNLRLTREKRSMSVRKKLEIYYDLHFSLLCQLLLCNVPLYGLHLKMRCANQWH